MLRRFGSRLHQASGPLALFLVLTGGIAYAANTIGSSDIINESILSEDVRNGQVTAGDLAGSSVRTNKVLDESLTGHDIQDDTIGGADVNESLLDVAQGRGTLLSNRLVTVPTTSKSLLTIPGLGALMAGCYPGGAQLEWVNTTSSAIDHWHLDVESGSGDDSWFATVAPPSTRRLVAFDNPSLGAVNQFPGGVISLGLGNDPGPRRTATINVFAFQSSAGAPCGFQAQGTLWTSP